MRFSVRSFLLFVTFICVALGSYQIGKRDGIETGYVEAKDHYQVILRGWSKDDRSWKSLGEWLSEGPINLISDRPHDARWKHAAYLKANDTGANEWLQYQGDHPMTTEP